MEGERPFDSHLHPPLVVATVAAIRAQAAAQSSGEDTSRASG